MSDQERISPYNFDVTQISNSSKEKCQLGDWQLIQHQILQTNIIRTV